MDILTYFVYENGMQKVAIVISDTAKLIKYPRIDVLSINGNMTANNHKTRTFFFLKVRLHTPS